MRRSSSTRATLARTRLRMFQMGQFRKIESRFVDIFFVGQSSILTVCILLILAPYLHRCPRSFSCIVGHDEAQSRGMVCPRPRELVTSSYHTALTHHEVDGYQI